MNQRPSPLFAVLAILMCQVLFVARDRIGEKPLYYSILPDQTLIFGSELKALLLHPQLRRVIDPCAIEEFFALGYIAEPRTIYHGVFKLPAGACLAIRRGRKPELLRGGPRQERRDEGHP